MLCISDIYLFVIQLFICQQKNTKDIAGQSASDDDDDGGGGTFDDDDNEDDDDGDDETVLVVVKVRMTRKELMAAEIGWTLGLVGLG